MERKFRTAVVALLAIMGIVTAHPASAWGDQGHKIVALVARQYLKPKVRNRVDAILLEDSSALTPSREMSVEATWADRFRDSDRNSTRTRYLLTRNWHFVNLKIDGASMASACSDHPPSPVRASEGPPDACIVDRISAFVAELKNPATSATERRLALQFLLHLIGDVHQPLHASDDNDQGGNGKNVKAANVAAGTLHSYWDSVFVMNLGSNPQRVAAQLVGSTTPGQATAWSKGDATSWAMQSFELAKLRAYRGLGTADAKGRFSLSTSYVTAANHAAARQLARAGVRLAVVLNDALQ